MRWTRNKDGKEGSKGDNRRSEAVEGVQMGKWIRSYRRVNEVKGEDK